ncbi:(3R)-hydroxymyristoyl-ACP dehydratase [Psychromonas sp. CNPT3]|uniref:ApeI family dehydratase n=1 Tax=Psychromonas sp. CNPT3 TaxID=314282 RepID=UPI00006E790D|nr:(3R)-hydroxymyristoyl-ACP dehydratase [Psychromonas sp. CNPT3]AGH79963.1 (3R)-hydroxymyristoyl-ACP dehydratase [Psychromonas sp. CNPT3]
MNNNIDLHKPLLVKQSVSENEATLVLKIEDNIAYFSGHFDENPILAGVVQLDWAIYYANKFFACGDVFLGMEVIKFQQPILPNTEIILTLRWQEDKQKLYFDYSDSEQVKYASGRIKLKAEQSDI